MRFSIWISASQSWSDILATAQHAEATGWDGVWVADHFMGSGGPVFPPETPMLEAGSLVAALAAAVPRVRIGTLVYGNTYRHPAVVANMAATVDHVSDGRFTLGIGAGWQENEHQQYGIELPPVRQRVDRFEEAVQVIQSLLREPLTTVQGDHYTVTDAVCEPKPVQDPLPLLIGASGEQRMLGIVAKYADQWNCWGMPELIAHKSAVLDEHCERVGRDPKAIARTAQTLLFVSDDKAAAEKMAESVGPRPAFGGTIEGLVDTIAEYDKVGLDEFIVPDFTLGAGQAKVERMDGFIEGVAPSFR
jgi:F420-dependent oxidoreductase-like protein